MGTLNELVSKGMVRAIGACNIHAWQIERCNQVAAANSWARLESVQLLYNLVRRDIETDLVPYCAENEISVIAYSPLHGGLLTGD